MRKKTESEVYKHIVNGDLFEAKPELIWWAKHDDKGFNYYSMMDGRSLIDTWPSGVTIFVTGYITVDMFHGGPYYVVVSDQVKKTMSLKWSNNVEFLPVDVVQKDSGEKFGPFWVINVIKVLEALDEEHTDWGMKGPPPPDEPQPHMGIIKPALKKEVVQNEGIFRISVRGHINGARHFISDELRKELKKAKATLGMDFLPVKVV